MKNKAYMKIGLDIVMCILLVLFYNKNVISMNYHEISGLIVIGLIILHNVINIKWIKSIGSKVFSGKLPFKTVISFFVNVILFLLTSLIGISGILISKTILTNISSNNVIWKLIHMSSSGYLLIFLGIHLGLHWTYIRSILKKTIKVPSSVSKTVGVILTVTVLALGIYNMFNSNFARWLSMPSKIMTINSDRDMNPEGNHVTNKPERNQANEMPKGSVQNSENRDNKQHPMDSQQIDIIKILSVMAKFLSIVLVFAIATYYFEKILSLQKR